MILRLDDARYDGAVEADLLGEATPEQRALLRSYKPRGEAQQAESALLDAIASLGESEEEEDTTLSAGDEHTLAAILSTFEADLGSRSSAPGRTRRRWLVGAAVTVAAAAAVMLFITLHSGSQASDSDIAVAPLAPALPTRTLPPLPNDAAPTTDEPLMWTIVEGSVGTASDANPLPQLDQDVELHARRRMCAHRAAIDVCVSEQSRFVWPGGATLVLVDGSVEVRSGDAALRVDVDDTRVVVAPHSSASIESRVGGWSVRVDDGSVDVIQPHKRNTLRGGETLARTAEIQEAKPGAKSASRPDDAAMLRQARMHWSAGEHDEALRLYARVTTIAPRSRAGRVAAVSAGQLQLQLNRPQQALKSFRRALRGHKGALAQDASYGEILALRALGRTDAADKATARFVSRYPGSAYSAKLKR